jgi:RNA polymerase sigma-70 factor (ECF subfamily)
VTLPAELEPLIDAAIARAEARFAHKPVARDVFVARIAAVLDDNADGAAIDAAAIERLHVADLYLACAAAAGDARAIALAEAELVPAVRQAAGRIDATPAFVDEVAQRARTKLLVGDDDGAAPAIAGYRGTGPIARWVRVVATRIALDLERERAKVAHDSESELERMPAPDDPELAVLWRDCAEQYKAALTAAFASLSQRDRNLMRQRYVDDLTIDALGTIYRVHPATAFRWIKQVEARLATATRAALMAKLALTESQVKSMERLVASQLHLSLTRMLGPRPRKPRDQQNTKLER